MGWRDQLVPASFRGVAFQVEGHNFEGGRRVAEHEYPLRDTPNTQDLGRKKRSFRVRAFVIGPPSDDAYFDARDALVSACEDHNTPGALNHPWLGIGISVRCVAISLSESANEGGVAQFDLSFVESGSPATPQATPDTSGAVIASTASAMSVLAQTLQIAADIAAAPAILLGEAGALLGAAAGAVAGVVLGVTGIISTVLVAGGAAALAVVDAVALAYAACNVIENVLSDGPAPVTSSVTGITGDPLAIAVTDMFTLAANAVLAIQTAPVDIQDTVGGQLYTYQRVAQDPTLGLVQLAGYGASLPTPTGLRADLQAGTQGDIVALVQGAAVLAVARIYANTDFTSSNAAQTARTLLLGLISDQVMAAAASANDPLYQAWVALAGQVSQDMLARILQLPALTTFNAQRGLPACVLAQRLYQDGTRGTQLALLNDVPHPGFLPPTGAALSS